MTVHLFIAGVAGQCPTEFTPVVVEDLETKRILINVENALNNDLSNRSQGLCGVNINFMVDRPGDISIMIVSPDGTQVPIIGPVIPSNSLPLPTTWDISFVPCGTTPTPDPGYNDIWSNDQPWGATLVPYTGSYLPVDNYCLEEFDSGPVNGQWTIVVQDDESRGNPTQILNFELIFCDPSGLECQKCDALAGFLPTPLVTAGCEGADELLTILDPYVGLTPPDPVSYTYLYAVTDLNSQNVVAVFTEPDFRSLSSGNYEICGLSVLTEQQPSIETEILGRNIDDFRTLLEDGSLSFCADLISDCFDMTIQPNDPPELTFDIQDLTCFISETRPMFNGANLPAGIVWTFPNGSIILESMPLITEAGIYQVSAISPTGCSDTEEYTVVQDLTIPDISITDPGELTCTSPSHVLNVTPVLDYVSQSWTGPDGYTSTEVAPVISAAGTYNFEGITLGGCLVGTAVNITQGNMSESVSIVDPGPLSCQSPSATLSLTPVLGYTSQNWTGPDGYTSTELSPTIVSPGTYDFQGVTASGCNVDASIVITQGNMSESVSIDDPGALSCQSPSVTLNLTPAQTYTSQNWTGPDGYTSTELSPTIISPGTYDFQGVTASGCNVDASIVITQGNMSESVSIDDPGPLSCQSPSVTLNLTPALNYTSQTWTGPEGYTSMDLSPSVMTPGTYFFEGEITGVCTASATITITEEQSTESVTIIDPGTLSCTVSSLTLSADSDAVIASYSWTGPSGYSSSDPNPSISLPGIYTLMVTTDESCLLTAPTIDVRKDADLPDINILNPGPIICGVGTVDLIIDGIASLASTQWTGPENFMSDASTISVDMPGLYTVVGMTPGGCAVNAAFEVISSNVPPMVILPENGNVIRTQCMEVYPVEIEVLDTYQSIIWEGPNGFIGSGLAVNLRDTGMYRITTTGQGICQDVSTIRLTVTDDFPELSFSVQDNSDCSNSSTIISVSSDMIINEYLWDGPTPVIGDGAEVGVMSNGMYKVTVTAMNNCRTVDSVSVNSVGQLSMGITDVMVQSMNPSCLGIADGSIAITNVEGGTGPYSLKINNSSYEIDEEISGLGPGDYTLTITDINDCTFEQVISLVDGATIDISMEEEYYVVFGEALTIRPEVVSANANYSLEWRLDIPFTTTNSTISFQPLFSLPLIVTVINETGCTQSDTTLIAVDKQIDIYMANVFVPGSVNNGTYQIASSQAVELIKSFSIFDRWGHTLFSQQNYVPSQVEGQWDGTYRGEEVEQGVYVYVAELQLIDGSLLRKEGTFTLIK